jgi:hypothetical protein
MDVAKTLNWSGINNPFALRLPYANKGMDRVTKLVGLLGHVTLPET